MKKFNKTPKMTIVEEFGSKFLCKQIYDQELNRPSIVVYEQGNRLGSIIMLTIPDKEDESKNIKFNNKVIDWILDNGY